MSDRIPYTKPSISALETQYAADAAQHGWGDACYEYIARFERTFCQHLGVTHAIATSSCTGAMHMGLAALGIGPGDEVIVPDTGWIATAAPIVHLGATPVFVDVKRDTWCIDPIKVEAAITSRTRAIVAVHLYGNLCEMRELKAIGERRNLPLIEDAAEAIGSSYFGQSAGTIGRFGTFSFHGTKTLTTGEGGMFVTDDTLLFERVLTLSNHGRVRGQTRQFWPEAVGFKYKMSNIQAAIGCAQVERACELVQRKRDILSFYRRALQPFPEVTMNPEPTGTVNGAWMPTVVFDQRTGITTSRVQAAFNEANIDARVFFQPLSSLPMFTAQRGNVVAYDVANRAMNLPSFHDITVHEQERVVDVIGLLIQEARRLSGRNASANAA